MKKYIEIISVFLSGLGIYLFDKIWGDKINWGKVSEFPFGKILSKQISVLSILIFILLTIIIFFLFKKFLNKDSYYNKKQRKLREFNKMEDTQNDLIYRWNVYFDFGQKPHIGDLEIFCNKHGQIPIRFIGGNCSDSNCSNYNFNIDKYKLKNYIESILIEKWEKIK